MKLITLVTLALLFIGCGSNPETPEPPLDAGGAEQQGGGGDPILPPPELEMEPEIGVASQTILTCSKEGAEDIIYIAKTYETPTPCQHSVATGKSCLCEVVSENSFFESRNGVYLYATSTADWCEGSALDSIEQNLGVTVYDSEGGTELVNAAHDASYTCSRS